MNLVFLSDVDGTLIKTNTPPHPKVIRAANQFVEAGGYFTLCTGRGISATAPLIEQLPINTSCILLGGGLIYDFDKKQILAMQTMDSSIIPLLMSIHHQFNDMSITLYEPDKIYNLRTNQRLLVHGVKADRIAPHQAIPDEAQIIKVLLTSDNIDNLAYIKKHFVPDDKFESHYGSKHFLEITSKNTNKGTAISTLKKLLHTQSIFHVAGNAQSDLAMRAHAYHFYAPTTAEEIVRRQADFLFPPPLEGGISEALDQSFMCL